MPSKKIIVVFIYYNIYGMLKKALNSHDIMEAIVYQDI